MTARAVYVEDRLGLGANARAYLRARDMMLAATARAVVVGLHRLLRWMKCSANAKGFRSFDNASRGRPVDGAGSVRPNRPHGSGPMVACDPRDPLDGAERGRSVRHFRFAASCRRQCLPAVSAGDARRKPP